MESAKVNGVTLEYEMQGSGDAVLLIPPVVAGGFRPFLANPDLTDRYRLIRYHKRGWGGSTHAPGPVSIADHAADAAALLDDLGIDRAHVAGHSSGAAVAVQLTIDRPDLVHTLTLLEMTLLDLPSAQPLLQRAGPFIEAYGAGDHETAVTGFLSVVSGLDRDTCTAVIEQNVPGGVAEAVGDADTFFGIELPALTAWEFEPGRVATISQPVLSVLGADTLPLWVDVADLLHTVIPHLEDCLVEGVGHLLHMQRPEGVIEGAGSFWDRHAMEGPRRATPSREEHVFSRV